MFQHQRSAHFFAAIPMSPNPESESNKWPDFIFVLMIMVSVLGLIYILLHK